MNNLLSIIFKRMLPYALYTEMDRLKCLFGDNVITISYSGNRSGFFDAISNTEDPDKS